MFELGLFLGWLSSGWRRQVRDAKDDDASGLLITALAMPLIVTIVFPYLLWACTRDRTGSRLIAGCWCLGGLLAVVLAAVQGIWWLAATLAFGFGAVSLFLIMWRGYQIEKAAALEENEETSGPSVPRWRFS